MHWVFFALLYNTQNYLRDKKWYIELTIEKKPERSNSVLHRIEEDNPWIKNLLKGLSEE
jgi:hypothetical protein